MRDSRLALAFISTCAAVLFSGCSSSVISGNASAASGAAPSVAAVGNQVNGVAPNRKQEVQFTEAMDPATINGQSFQVADSTGKSVAGTVSYDLNFDTASFQPDPSLQPNATYTATITTAAASTGGVHLGSAYSYSFTTRASSDSSPLAVTSVEPAVNATCVSTTTPITITFNEAPDTSTLTASNFVVTGPGGPITVKLNTSVATTQVVLVPSAALPSGSINVTVSNVADLAGVEMAAPYTWSFSTACNGGGGGGTTTTQYRAPLIGKTGSGQVTVDTMGNVAVQVQGAKANTSYTVQFCPLIPLTASSPNCFATATVSTDASGNGSTTVKFPKTGSWAGDFALLNGPANPNSFVPDFMTTYGPNYLSTLQPDNNLDGGILNQQQNNQPQAPLKSGTVTFSSSPAPNGSFQFTLTGATPNTTFSATESNGYTGGSDNYQLENSQRQMWFTTDNQGNLTFTVLPDGVGGDIMFVDPKTDLGFTGGFFVP